MDLDSGAGRNYPSVANGSTRLTILSLSKERGEGRFSEQYVYSIMDSLVIPRDKNISECMKSIKGFSARQINAVFDRRGSILQGGFYDYILDSEEKGLSRMRYIEDNPVRKGMVTNAEDYGYSSMKYRAETDFTKFF